MQEVRERKETKEQAEVKQSKWPLYASLLLAAGLIITYFAVPEVKDFVDNAFAVLTSRDEQRITDWVDRLGFWGPLFVILFMILQMFLIVVPSPLLMLVAILAYGPVWGVVLSVAAVLIASSIGFFIGTFLSDVTLKKIIGSKQMHKMEHYVEEYGAWAVVMTRLVPFLSNDAISFVGGILKMSYLKFITATAVGIVPLAVLLAYFGADNARLESGLLWLTGICVAVFIVYLIVKRRRKHHHT
jgi:uncharacterized membrane protein YdjX (TVP38/TMEM64 family)